MKKALRNYFLAEDLAERDSSLLSRLAQLACGSLPTVTSLGAIYEFRSDPESLLFALGAIENLRVWTRYNLSN